MRAAHWVCLTDLAASRRHWAEARRLLLSLPDTAERSRLLLEVYPELLYLFDRLGGAAAEVEALFHEAVVLAQQAGDRRTEALIEAAYSNLKATRNDFDSIVT